MGRAVPVLAGLLAVGATIAAGFIYAMSFPIAPMPWPWLFAAVWLGFVFVAVIGALRSPYRTLVVPIIAAATGAIWLFVGQQFFGWAP